MRFWGSERGRAHARWYAVVADHYDHLYDPSRVDRADPFLRRLFVRQGRVKDVLDVACGTFALDLPLTRRGYRLVGRDLSEDMLRVARRNLRDAGQTADLDRADMRSLHVAGRFDAVLCLGTAFNYLPSLADARKALGSFHGHLRPRGLLVLDLTNFDAWIRHPQNARAEVDHIAADGTRIAIFAFNDQDFRTKTHHARFVTVVRRRGRIDLGFDEARLRIWTREELARTLRTSGFRPIEWWGDLQLGATYDRRRSPRLVSVSRRT